MGAQERIYRERVQRAFAEIDTLETAPASPEAALQRFLQLMDAMMPVIDKLPRPQPAREGEPDETGLYKRWRELESRRHHHA